MSLPRAGGGGEVRLAFSGAISTLCALLRSAASRALSAHSLLTLVPTTRKYQEVNHLFILDKRNGEKKIPWPSGGNEHILGSFTSVWETNRY